MRGAGALLAGVALAGCSQVSALAPVGGGAQTTVRIAAIDVLLEKGVDVAVAPSCALEGTTITCTGRTADGKAIDVHAEKADPQRLTVSVGGTQVFDGTADEVIERSGRVGA